MRILIFICSLVLSGAAYGIDRAAHPENSLPIEATSKSSCLPMQRIPAPPEVGLRAMVSSLVVTGFPGNQVNAQEFVEFIQLLETYPFGGFIFLERNVATSSEVRRIVNALHRPSRPTPFIMSDEEGGAVSRLDKLPDVPVLPAAADVSRTESVDRAYDLYLRLADALRHLGINVNLGPVVDLEINPHNPVIARYRRSFSPDPDTVIAYGRAFIQAHAETGIVTALKHFPGHGSSDADTHFSAANVTDHWHPDELRPFSVLSAEGHAPLIMTSHVTIQAPQFEQTSPEIATFSQNVVSYIRNELCHGGLIITDDMTMSAVSAETSLADATEMALRAGHDIVIIAGREWIGTQAIANVVEAVANAADQDAHLKAAIEAAFARVIHFKREYLKAEGEPSQPDRSRERTHQWERELDKLEQKLLSSQFQ